MELEESTCLTSDYTTKPQSSRQYGTGTKTEIWINGTNCSFLGNVERNKNAYVTAERLVPIQWRAKILVH